MAESIIPNHGGKIEQLTDKIGNIDGTKVFTASTRNLNEGYEQIPAGIYRIGQNVQNSPGQGFLLNLTGNTYNTQLFAINSINSIAKVMVRSFRSTDENINPLWHGIVTETITDALRASNNANDTVTFEIPSSYRGILIFSHRDDANGMFLVNTASTSGSTPLLYEIKKGPDITVTTGPGTITVKTTNALAGYVTLINLNNNPTKITYTAYSEG